MDLEIKTFLGPVKRYRAVRHIWGPKKSRFPEPNPLPLGQVMDLPASKALRTCRISQRSIGSFMYMNVCILYSVFCILYSVFCILYFVFCIFNLNHIPY
jgi:hypothetical protein